MFLSFTLQAEYGLRLASHIFVKDISPESLAARDGNIQEGDVVLKVSRTASGIQTELENGSSFIYCLFVLPELTARAAIKVLLCAGKETFTPPPEEMEPLVSSVYLTRRG